MNRKLQILIIAFEVYFLTKVIYGNDFGLFEISLFILSTVILIINGIKIPKK